MNYERDEITEIYEAKLEQDQAQSSITSTSVQFTDGQKKFVFFVALAFYYFVYMAKSLPFNNGAVILAGIILFIYISNKGQVETNRRPLNDREVKAIVFKELEWKQKNTGEIPPGIIRVGPICRRPNIEGKAWKWQVGAEIDKEEGGVESYLVETHSHTGDIISIKDYPEGFTGREVFDIRFIRTRQDLFDDKYKRKPTRSII